MAILRRLLSMLPPAWRRAAKRAYYPRMLRRFPASRWPGASVVERLLRPGDVVVDAGANIGYVSMLLARWVGPTGRVYSFEPMPETYAFLRHNMASLGLRQVEALHLALSSQQGEGRMTVPDYPDGGPNFYEAHLLAEAGGDGAVSVAVRRLDDVLAREPRPVAFMKIDVEGHEWELARGAERRLVQDRPALFVELSGPPCGDGPAGRLARHLHELGYGAWWLDGGALKPVAEGDRPVDAFFLTPDQLARARG